MLQIQGVKFIFSIISQVPLSSICYHGSRLVQALARFKERSLLLSSLRTLNPADLLTLASDPAGSHVLQALITTSSDKGRGKILRRLEVRAQAILELKRLVDELIFGLWTVCSAEQATWKTSLFLMLVFLYCIVK